jgi:sec-independent protein translocase protein TatC
VKVSLYAAVCLSVPFLLWQIWAFVAPGLYPHERGYALPFVVLASLFFVGGAAFAYYIIFPPARYYLLGLGQDFRLLLKPTTISTSSSSSCSAWGLFFRCPPSPTFSRASASSRPGCSCASGRLRSSSSSSRRPSSHPTSDVPNMMLFAAPMLVLYVISIFVAWIFGRARTTTEVRG